MPRDASDAEIRRRVDEMARRHRIDRIAALDDFDVEMAAMLREHLRVPGMGRTTASRFRDKLAMRMQARTLGIPVPEFSAVFNDQEVGDWAGRVTPPWVLKPRSSAAAIGIKKVADRDALWRALDAAGDDRAQCVLEQFVPGDVYHVDSIVWGGEVVFAVAFKYGRPPMEVSHQGGIFITRRLPDDSDEGRAVLAMNRTLQEGLGLRRGVSHTEFIRARWAGAGGSGAVVGSCFSKHPRASAAPSSSTRSTRRPASTCGASGRRSRSPGEAGTYAVPPHRDDYAGIVLTLARQEAPDMSAYTDPEIVTTIRKDHHAGIIVSAPEPQRVEALIADYTQRFYRDFFATAPPPERPVE